MIASDNTNIGKPRLDRAKALAVWEAYQRAHDLSARKGEAVGVDPETGHVWFGTSILDICHQQDAAGETQPLLFLRVGEAAYWRKGLIPLRS